MVGDEIDWNHVDDHVDEEIAEFLNLKNPKSFFLYAGAGSGKTRSLITALKHVRRNFGERLRIDGRKIGVVSFTNAACNEIGRRLEFDEAFAVSTIHSFAWSMISGFDNDIRTWLEKSLSIDILELNEKQKNSNSKTKTWKLRERQIEKKSRRLEALHQIKKFKYDPNSDNIERDSLSHSEVIKITSEFLLSKKILRSILINRYPFLLIDESQDTNKNIIEALFYVQKEREATFGLGLFGDTMQRIYGDGLASLGHSLPDGWVNSEKEMNHRSGARIVTLANKMREPVDGRTQRFRDDRPEGFVRLFILPSHTHDKFAAEEKIAHMMAETCTDEKWLNKDEYKTLTLEHHMAASRMGFLEIFRPLNNIDRLQTGLRDGSLPGIRLFSENVWPLVQAVQCGDDFEVMRLLKKTSPLLSKAVLKTSDDQRLHLKSVDDSLKSLANLWNDEKSPSFLEVLQEVARSGLFAIPESLEPFETKLDIEIGEIEIPLGEDEVSEALEEINNAWLEFLNASFAQIEPYKNYVNGLAPFDTHQGVKGLEFPRVMVIVDDEDSRGFLFSYEKLFGVKEKSARDEQNEAEGKETGIDRTRRLFYVTCTRAEESLAIVAYISNPANLKKSVLQQGWFTADEVLLI